ncbi:hypothetical protein CEP53_001312 [Fusarium sp. AF-6]|nr:hypothetical protein CEP53_001312 [Fusarium sp. AF-6]
MASSSVSLCLIPSLGAASAARSGLPEDPYDDVLEVMMSLMRINSSFPSSSSSFLPPLSSSPASFFIQLFSPLRGPFINMEPWKTSSNWALAQSGPVDSGPNSFPPPEAVTSSSNPALAAAPTISAPAQTAATSFYPSTTAAAPAAAVAPLPTANGAGRVHRCPHCHKMGIHRPEECRSAPQNSTYMPSLGISEL